MEQELINKYDMATLEKPPSETKIMQMLKKFNYL